MSTTIEKTKVMLSLPIETNQKLAQLANVYGMTKSGLVNLLVQKLEQEGKIF